eukprot:1193762-Prorocentrum_minimum.AAC.5
MEASELQRWRADDAMWARTGLEAPAFGRLYCELKLFECSLSGRGEHMFNELTPHVRSNYDRGIAPTLNFKKIIVGTGDSIAEAVRVAPAGATVLISPGEYVPRMLGSYRAATYKGNLHIKFYLVFPRMHSYVLHKYSQCQTSVRILPDFCQQDDI